MSELKTLKDIESFNKLNPRFVNRDRLKQEAIKDIKKILEFEKKGEDFWIGDFCFYCIESIAQNVIDYIKWKFNITEEDLK